MAVKYFTIEEIKSRWEHGVYSCKDKPTRTKLPETYIFDDNLTVKENRRMVIENNNALEQEKKNIRKKQMELHNMFYDDIINYLRYGCGFTLKVSERIYNKVYSEHHSFMNDFFMYLDDTADFVREILGNWFCIGGE